MPTRPLFTAILISLSILAPSNDGYMATSGGALNYSQSQDIRLFSEDLRVTLGKDRASIRVDFLFRNEGEAQTATMGFPENWDQDHKAGALTRFRTEVDGKPVQATRVVTSREEYDLKAIWTKQVQFKARQTRRVRVQYDPAFSGSAYGFSDITYILTTGATWKGRIGHLRITVDATHADPKDEVHLNLLDKKRNKKAVWWSEPRADVYTLSLKDVEPDFDLSVDLIPWFWRYTVNGNRVPSSVASRITFPVPQRRGDEIIASMHTIGMILGGKTPDDEWDMFSAIDSKGDLWPRILDPKTVQLGDRRVVLKRGLVKLANADGEPAESAFLSDFVRALGGTYRFDRRAGKVIINVPRAISR